MGGVGGALVEPRVCAGSSGAATSEVPLALRGEGGLVLSGRGKEAFPSPIPRSEYGV